jgi:hypothetical protein
MILPDPTLTPLARSLAEVSRNDDADLLRDYLRGRRLPALGGDLRPAEILEAALGQAPQVPETAAGLARTLARIVLEASSRQLDSGDRAMILNALELAASLPPEPTLFDALETLRSAVAEDEVFILPLWQALLYLQTDRRLLKSWFQMMEILVGTEYWTPHGRALLFTAWRGLLWLPPERPDPGQDVAPIIDFDLAERGLLALHEACFRHGDGARWLRHALDLLTDTYPRSRAFWEAHLAPRLAEWPPLLQRVALQKWPGLASHANRAASA